MKTDTPLPYSGLTKREYFASLAPSDIPDFFQHVQPVKNFDTIDWSTLSADDDKLCRSWQRDPFWELPDHLKWFQEQTNKILDQKQAWEKLNAKERYFQWQTFYADSLVEQLNKTTQL